jgi:F-type H+-transporting ATPase subunit a
VIGLLAAVFEPPSTKDFVFGCWGGAFKLFGFDTCFNFIILLVVLTTIIVLALFYLSLRRPKVVPGKFQLLAELGVDFVRENVAVPMLGQDAAKFMPLLARCCRGSASRRTAGSRSRSSSRWCRG